MRSRATLAELARRDAAVRRLHARGLSDYQAAQCLGLSPDQVRHSRERLGLPPNFGRGRMSAQGLADVRRKLRARLCRDGVDALSDYRRDPQRLAAEYRWRGARTLREADALDTLACCGAVTAPQLSALLGSRCRRATFARRLLTALCERGLVVTAAPPGRGYTKVYQLAEGARRGGPVDLR